MLPNESFNLHITKDQVNQNATNNEYSLQRQIRAVFTIEKKKDLKVINNLKGKLL